MNTKTTTVSTNNKAAMPERGRHIHIMKMSEVSSHSHSQQAKALEQFIANAISTAD